MLQQHWNILMQIINLYLRDKHKTVVDFARACCGYVYKLLCLYKYIITLNLFNIFSTFFVISESVQKSILKKLLELTCEKANQNTTNFALQMLRVLWQLYPKVLHNWGMLLLVRKFKHL